MSKQAIYLIGVGTDPEKTRFWEAQANAHHWAYKLVGREGKYEWTSNGTKINYILDAIKGLPPETKYVLISDTYDSFVNTSSDDVLAFFEQFEGTVHFGNDLKYYEAHKGIYTTFPKRYANKLHNHIILDDGHECYLQAGIIGGNREAVVQFYEKSLPHILKGRREQKSMKLMLNHNPEVLSSLRIIGLDKFAHLFTRVYLFNFRSVSYDPSKQQFLIDGNRPWVIHCPGALRPTITSYFWKYFISHGTKKNWRILPFIRTFHK